MTIAELARTIYQMTSYTSTGIPTAPAPRIGGRKTDHGGAGRSGVAALLQPAQVFRGGASGSTASRHSFRRQLSLFGPLHPSRQVLIRYLDVCIFRTLDVCIFQTPKASPARVLPQGGFVLSADFCSEPVARLLLILLTILTLGCRRARLKLEVGILKPWLCV